MESGHKPGDQAGDAVKASALKAEETRDHAGSAADGAETIVKERVQLMGVYQTRLNHEYDKGWEQIRITAYVSGGILAVTGFLISAAPESNIALLIRALATIGFLLALGSLINQIGSQLDARDLRKTLAGLEGPLDPTYYRQHTGFAGHAGYGLLLISTCMTLFWLAALCQGTNVIKGTNPNLAPGQPIPSTPTPVNKPEEKKDTANP